MITQIYVLYVHANSCLHVNSTCEQFCSCMWRLDRHKSADNSFLHILFTFLAAAFINMEITFKKEVELIVISHLVICLLTMEKCWNPNYSHLKFYFKHSAQILPFGDFFNSYLSSPLYISIQRPQSNNV